MTRPASTWLIARGIACALAVVGCSADGNSSTPTTEAETTTTRNPKYDLTFEDWEAQGRSTGEVRFVEATGSAFGIGTNPNKMLEYGYDLCELYEDANQGRGDIIEDWALENNQPTARASLLGDAATDHLCP